MGNLQTFESRHFSTADVLSFTVNILFWAKLALNHIFLSRFLDFYWFYIRKVKIQTANKTKKKILKFSAHLALKSMLFEHEG